MVGSGDVFEVLGGLLLFKLYLVVIIKFVRDFVL